MRKIGEMGRAAYDLLVIVGASGESLELHDMAVTTTVVELRDRISEYFAYGNPDSYVIELCREDGTLLLSSDQSLQDAGVRSGDRLQVVSPIGAGGPEWTEVGKYFEQAVASGITGNAAFYLLKSSLKSITARWHRLREARRASCERDMLDGTSAMGEVAGPELLPLEQDEAVAIAVYCVCLKFDVSPHELKVLSAKHEGAMSGGADEWTILLRTDAIDNFESMHVRVKVPSANPEQSLILIVPPWVDSAG
jgi:hypothetical protein